MIFKKNCCKAGHEYTPENTRVNNRCERTCLQCKKLSDSKYFSSPKGQTTIFTYNLKRRLKVNNSLEEYNKLLAKQDNKYAICFTDKAGGHGRFHIDHDHITGKIRGLLCSKCNLVLGLVKDKREVLLKAIEYLSCY